MIKAANATEKQLNLVKLHEQTKKTLDQEILNYRDEAQKQRKIIFQLEKERDRYINEASDLTQKVTPPRMQTLGWTQPYFHIDPPSPHPNSTYDLYYISPTAEHQNIIIQRLYTV